MFRRNPRLEEQLQPQVNEGLVKAGEAVKDFAEKFAPRGATKHYANSFVVIEDGDVVAVGNTDFAAWWVEVGSVNNPPYAPLRRGVRAAGLRFEEQSK